MGAILVVDDRSINRKFLAALLGYAGHTVVEAADGNEALSIAQRNRPQLIITDLIMPVMDGVELVNQLRADPATADIPVVFYTATYRVHEARELARSCGVDLVLPKPCEPQVILDAVAKILCAEATKVEIVDARGRMFATAGQVPLHELAGLQQRLNKALDEDGDATRESSEPARRIDTRGQPLTKFHALSMRLAALLELGLTLGAERDPQSLLNLFCRAAQDIIGTHYAGVIVVDAEQGTSLEWSASGLDDRARADLGSINLAQGFMGEVLHSKEPICLLVLDGDATRGGLPASHPPIETLLATPMRFQSGIAGVMYLADKIGGAAFNEDDEQFAATLAAQLALSYGNLKLFEDMQRHAGELHIEAVERKRVAEELSSSEARYRRLFDANPLPMWVYDLETLAFLAVNDAAVEHYGYTREQFLAMTIADIRSELDVSALMKSVNVESAGISHSGVWRHRKRDGGIIEVEITSHHIDFSGRGAKLVLANDITERVEQDRKIARLTRIRAVLGGISSAMLRLRDRDELLQEACRVATTEGVFPLVWITALNPQTQSFEIVAWYGEDPRSLDFVVDALRKNQIPEHDLPSVRAAQTRRAVVINDLSTDPVIAPIRADMLRRGLRSCAAFPLSVQSEVVAVLVLLAAERDFFDAEEIALLDWLTADLSFALEHVEKSQRLDYLASYDTLTGLPNVRLFSDRLEQLVHAARQDHCSVCVVVVDMERFTQINDTLGRSVGDELLRQIGARFEEFLVEPYALGRISADTFAAASPRDSESIATKLRDRMLDAIKQPFSIDGHEVNISVQAGIALFPADGDDGKGVFKNAEAALKLTKSSGDRYKYYSSEMNARMALRVALEKQLRTAIEMQQFVLHYQPKVDMISGELVGAEALIRWQHPDKVLMAPAEFIHLGEETGLIVPIGSWAIHAVCAQQAAWIAAGLGIVPIAVNLSSVQFEKDDLLHTVRTALEAHSLDAKQLDLELTESAVMNDSAAAAKTLQALRKLGVGLALDDFGTGYSSLAHLKRFPFNSVKIDRSFVTDITSNAEDAAIAIAIIAMAHSLNLKVVAEGIETQGQFNYLRAHACDQMQGNFFSPAVPAEVFESDLRSGKRMRLLAPALADQRTLLLVDDEPHICAALTRMLRPDGYRILTATSGLEGLEVLAVNTVQVIISDQRMPGMSGTEFLNTVKQLYPNTVRIILSGYTDLEVVTEAVNLGSVFKFLTKPWNDDLLREQVRDAFRRYRPEPKH